MKPSFVDYEEDYDDDTSPSYDTITHYHNEEQQYTRNVTTIKLFGIPVYQKIHELK